MDKNLSKSAIFGRGQQEDDNDVASSSGSSSISLPETRSDWTKRKSRRDCRREKRGDRISRANTNDEEDDRNERRDSELTIQGPYHALQLAASRLSSDMQDGIAQQLESVEEQLEAVGLQMQEAIASGFKDGTFRSRLRNQYVERMETQPLHSEPIQPPSVTSQPTSLVKRKGIPSIQKPTDRSSQTSPIAVRYSTHNSTDAFNHHDIRYSNNSQEPLKQKPISGRSWRPLACNKNGVKQDDDINVNSRGRAHQPAANRSDYDNNTPNLKEMEPNRESSDSKPSDKSQKNEAETRVYRARGCQTCRCHSCRVPSDPIPTVQILGVVSNSQPGPREFVSMDVKGGRIPQSLGLIEICRDFEAQEGEYDHTWKPASVLQQFSVERPSNETAFPRVPPVKDEEYRLHVENPHKQLGPGENSKNGLHEVGQSSKVKSKGPDTRKWKNAVLQSKVLQEQSRSWKGPGGRELGSVYDEWEYPAGQSSPALDRLEKAMEPNSSADSSSDHNNDSEGKIRSGFFSEVKKLEHPTSNSTDDSFEREKAFGEGTTEYVETQSLRHPAIETVKLQEGHTLSGPRSSQVKERRRSKSNLDPENQPEYVTGSWKHQNQLDHITQAHEDGSNSTGEEIKPSQRQNEELSYTVDNDGEVKISTRPPSGTKAPAVVVKSNDEFIRTMEGGSPHLPWGSPLRSYLDFPQERPTPHVRPRSSGKRREQDRYEASNRHVAQPHVHIDVRQEYEPGDDVSHEEVQDRSQDEIAKEFAFFGVNNQYLRSKTYLRSKSESDLPGPTDYSHEYNNAVRPEIFKLEESDPNLDNLYREDSDRRFKTSKKLSPSDGIPSQIYDIPPEYSSPEKNVCMEGDAADQSLGDAQVEPGPPYSVSQRLAAVGASKRRSKSARRPRFEQNEFLERATMDIDSNIDATHQDANNRRPTPYPIPLSPEARMHQQGFLRQLQNTEKMEEYTAERRGEWTHESDQPDWTSRGGETSVTAASGSGDNKHGVDSTKSADAIVQILNRKSSRTGNKRKSRQASVQHIVSDLPRDRSLFLPTKSELIGSISRQNSIAQMEMNASMIPGHKDIELIDSIPLNSQPDALSEIHGPLRDPPTGQSQGPEPLRRYPTMVDQNWDYPQNVDNVHYEDRNGQKLSKKNLKSLDSKTSQTYLAKMLTRLSQKLAVLESKGLIATQIPKQSEDFGSQGVVVSESLEPGGQDRSSRLSIWPQESVEPESRQQFDHIHLRKSHDLTNLMRRRNSQWPFQQDLSIQAKDILSPSLVGRTHVDQEILQMSETSTKWSHRISRDSMMTNNLELLFLDMTFRRIQVPEEYEPQEDWQPATPHRLSSRDPADEMRPKVKLHKSLHNSETKTEADSSSKNQRDLQTPVQPSFTEIPIKTVRNHRSQMTENWESRNRQSIQAQTSEGLSAPSGREWRDGERHFLSRPSIHHHIPDSSEASSHHQDGESLHRHSIHTQTSDATSAKDHRQNRDGQVQVLSPHNHSASSKAPSGHQVEIPENLESRRRQSIHTQTSDMISSQDGEKHRVGEVQDSLRPTINHNSASSGHQTQMTEKLTSERSQSVHTQTWDWMCAHGDKGSRDGQVPRPSIHHNISVSSRGHEPSTGWEEPAWDRSLERWNPAASKRGQHHTDNVVGTTEQFNVHSRRGMIAQNEEFELRRSPTFEPKFPERFDDERADSMVTHPGDLGFRDSQLYQHPGPQLAESFYFNDHQDSRFLHGIEMSSRQHPVGGRTALVSGHEFFENLPQNQVSHQLELDEKVSGSNHLSHNRMADSETLGGMNFRDQLHSQQSQFERMHSSRLDPKSSNFGHEPLPFAGNRQYSHGDRMHTSVVQPETTESGIHHHSQNEMFYNHAIHKEHLGVFPEEKERMFDHRMESEDMSLMMSHHPRRDKMYSNRMHPEGLESNNRHSPQIGKEYRGHAFAGNSKPNESKNYYPSEGAMDPAFRHQPHSGKMYGFPTGAEQQEVMDTLSHNWSQKGMSNLPGHLADGGTENDHYSHIGQMHPLGRQPEKMEPRSRRSPERGRMHSAVQPHAEQPEMMNTRIRHPSERREMPHLAAHPEDLEKDNHARFGHMHAFLRHSEETEHESGHPPVLGRMHSFAMQPEAEDGGSHRHSNMGRMHGFAEQLEMDTMRRHPSQTRGMPHVPAHRADLGTGSDHHSQTGQIHPSVRHPEKLQPESHHPPELGRMHSFAMQPEAEDGRSHHNSNMGRMHGFAEPPGMDTMSRHLSQSLGMHQDPDLRTGSDHHPNVGKIHHYGRHPEEIQLESHHPPELGRMHSFAMQPDALDGGSHHHSADIGIGHSLDLERMHNYGVQPEGLDAGNRRQSEIERMHSFAVHPEALRAAIRRSSNTHKMHSSGGLGVTSRHTFDGEKMQKEEKNVKGRRGKGSDRAIQEQQSFPPERGQMDRRISMPSERMPEATSSPSRHPSRKEQMHSSQEQKLSSRSGRSPSETEGMHRGSVQPQVTRSQNNKQKRVPEIRSSHYSIVRRSVNENSSKDFEGLQRDKRGAKKKTNSVHHSVNDLPPEVLSLGSKNPRKSSQIQLLNDMLQDLEATVTKSRRNSQARRKSNMLVHELDAVARRNGEKPLKHIELQAPKDEQINQDGKNNENFERFDRENSGHVEAQTSGSHDGTPEAFDQDNFGDDQFYSHPDELDGDNLHPFEDELGESQSKFDFETSGLHPFEEGIHDLPDDESGILQEITDEPRVTDLEGSSHALEISDHHDDGQDSISTSRSRGSNRSSGHSSGGTRTSSSSKSHKMTDTPTASSSSKDQPGSQLHGNPRRSQTQTMDVITDSNLQSHAKAERRRTSLRSILKVEPRKSILKNYVKDVPRLRSQRGRELQDIRSQAQLKDIPRESENTEHELRRTSDLTPAELETNDEYESAYPDKERKSHEIGGEELVHSETEDEEFTSFETGGDHLVPYETEGGDGLLPYETEGEELIPFEAEGAEPSSSLEREGEEFTSPEIRHGDDDSREPPVKAAQTAERRVTSEKRVTSRVFDDKDSHLSAKAKAKRLTSIVKDFVSGASSSRHDS